MKTSSILRRIRTRIELLHKRWLSGGSAVEANAASEELKELARWIRERQDD